MASEASVQDHERVSTSSSADADEELSSSSSFASIAFAANMNFLSMLGVLIQLRFQSNNVSLFEEHKSIVYSFVVVTTIYIGTIIVGKRKFRTKPIVASIRLLSGTISPVLLLLILVPIFGWLLFVLWVFLAAKISWDYLIELQPHFVHQPATTLIQLPLPIPLPV